MNPFGLALLTFVVCHLTLIDQSEAMHGLCSTDWYTDEGCIDNSDECKELGGKCFHDGKGDHGEGCECKKKVRYGSGWRWIILEKHHIPTDVKQPKTNKPIKYT